MKRAPIVQDRQPQGCGYRAYMDVFTACPEQWVPFLSVSAISTKWLACALLLVITATVSAQSADEATELLYEENSEQVVDAEVTNTETGPAAKTPDIEEYNIHRVDNHKDPCDRGIDTYDYEKSWYDSSQIYINSSFCEPALWFDNFFSSDRLFEEGVAGTYIRWRNEFTLDEEEGFNFKMQFNASVELPGLKNRLRLTFSDEDDEDLRDIAPGNGESTANSLGLQIDLAENARSKFNVNVSLSPKIRFRYRYTYPVLENLTLRLTQEVQRKGAIHSARTLFDFEQLFENQLLFRASTEAKFSEEFDGVEWLQALVLFQRVNKKASLSYEASVNGITEPRKLATNYRIGVRYRKNFHREWLFYEIVPEVSWPITLDESQLTIVTDRHSKWLLFFRLEIHFGNAYKKRYKDYN